MGLNSLLYENTKSIKIINDIFKNNLANEVVNKEIVYDYNDNELENVVYNILKENCRTNPNFENKLIDDTFKNKLANEIVNNPYNDKEYEQNSLRIIVNDLFKEKYNNMGKDQIKDFFKDNNNRFMIDTNFTIKDLLINPNFKDILIDNIKSDFTKKISLDNLISKDIESKIYPIYHRGSRFNQKTAELVSHIPVTKSIIDELSSNEDKNLFKKTVYNNLNEFYYDSNFMRINRDLPVVLTKDDYEIFMESKLSDNYYLLSQNTFDLLANKIGFSEEQVYNIYKNIFDSKTIDNINDLERVLNTDSCLESTFYIKTLSGMKYELKDKNVYEEIKGLLITIKNSNITNEQKLILEKEVLTELHNSKTHFIKDIIKDDDYSNSFIEVYKLKDFDTIDKANLWKEDFNHKDFEKGNDKLDDSL